MGSIIYAEAGLKVLLNYNTDLKPNLKFPTFPKAAKYKFFSQVNTTLNNAHA